MNSIAAYPMIMPRPVPAIMPGSIAQYVVRPENVASCSSARCALCASSIKLFANNFIDDAHNAHLADEHDATFSGRTTYWAMLPGMIAGTGLGIIIGYAAILFTPFHERIAAIWIMSAAALMIQIAAIRS